MKSLDDSILIDSSIFLITGIVWGFGVFRKIKEKIKIDKIYEVIYRTFDTMPMSKDIDLNTIYEIDKQTRIEAEKVVKSIS